MQEGGQLRWSGRDGSHDGSMIEEVDIVSNTHHQ